jgi:hypothetical protein
VGLTREQLNNALLVAMKSKVPRLRVDSSCTPYLYFNVTLLLTKNDENGHVVGYAFHVDLEVFREAHIRMTDRYPPLLRVWDKGGLYVGPMSRTKATVLEKLEEFVTDFSAAYYKAGNP